DPDDPSTWPPGVDGTFFCITKAPLDGIKIPNRSLAAMYLGYGTGSDSNGFAPNVWNNAAILAANGGVSAIQMASGNKFQPPHIFTRSDPDETSYYLQLFESIAAPDVWKSNQKIYPGSVWEPITEHLPIQIDQSRDGSEQQVDQIGLPGSADDQGALADAPPSTLIPFNSTFSNQVHVLYAQIKNHNGDWVTPNPASINAAVDAG